MNKIKQFAWNSFPSILLIAAFFRTSWGQEILADPLYPTLFVLDLAAMAALIYFGYWFFAIVLPRFNKRYAEELLLKQQLREKQCAR